MALLDVAGVGSRLTALLELGGPVVVLLLLMSIVGLVIALVKLWQFHALRIGRSGFRFVEGAIDGLRAGRTETVQEQLAGERNPTARVLEAALDARLRRGLSPELVREEATRVASSYLDGLRGSLRGLEVIGALAPLLGLLGTVLGMIEAFRQLEAAGSQVDPSLLSGGIWEALMTTAVGLAVAIPAVVLLNWLEGRVERFRHRMEDAVTRLFTQTGLMAEADAEAAATPPGTAGPVPAERRANAD